VRRVSVDETSARRGPRYVTNVLDAETHELLLMVEGRSAEALEAFAQALVAHGRRPEQIALISMNTSPAYQSGASQFFPQAEIVFDRFHLMQMAGQASSPGNRRMA
jgi:transposase